MAECLPAPRCRTNRKRNVEKRGTKNREIVHRARATPGTLGPGAGRPRSVQGD